MTFMYHNPTTKINKARFNAIFTKVWAKSLTPENILNGFKATGLYPFDPNAISEDAYAPSLLTETAPHKSTGNVDSDMQRTNNSDTDVTDVEDSTAHRIMPNPNFSPSFNLRNDSDIDATNAENDTANIDSRNTVVSPSLLISPEPVALSPQTWSSKVQAEDELQFHGRLVDYSSSLDSEPENIENDVAELRQSPVPGPSGISGMGKPVPGPTRICKPTTFSDTDSGSSPLHIEDLLQHHNRGVIAFDPYSDSETDTENNCLKRKSEKTPV